MVLETMAVADTGLVSQVDGRLGDYYQSLDRQDYDSAFADWCEERMYINDVSVLNSEKSKF